MQHAPPTPSRPPHNPLSTAIRAFLAFSLIAPLSVVYMAVCLLLLPWRSLRIRVGNLYGKIVGRCILGAVGITPVVHDPLGMLGAGPALFACNHTSTLDMWAGMVLCPFGGCGVAKKEIVKVPFFGQAYLLSGHLLVDRGDRERAIASMEKVQQVVRRHRLSLWMWPEGTRSRDGRLQPLKKGFIHLAISTGLKIVPLVVHDADLMWPGHSLRVVPGQVRIDVLAPLDTAGWRAETADEHALELWTRFQGALGPRQQGSPPAAG